MTSPLRHEIQLINVDGLYVSKGIHFGLLIRRTTVNISFKYPGKQNLFQKNSEIINISRMFAQWIVVPHFADCLCGILPSIGGHGSGVDSSRILRLFLEPKSSISEKTGPEPESLLFLALTGLCTVFTKVIASVQNKHCWIAVASMVAGDWTGVGFSDLKNFEPRHKNFEPRHAFSI